MKRGSHREPFLVPAGGGASPSPATLEERLARIEGGIELIARRLGIDVSGSDGRPGGIEYGGAIGAVAAGNRKPLAGSVRRGGEIPPR